MKPIPHTSYLNPCHIPGETSKTNRLHRDPAVPTGGSIPEEELHQHRREGTTQPGHRSVSSHDPAMVSEQESQAQEEGYQLQEI